MPPERVAHLLEHAAWLRALARRLAADEHAADDLVQDTLVAALEGAPPGGAGRGWLAVVLRNFARQTRRAAGRRDARERAAARPEESSADPVAEIALQRTLLAAVEALAEPYRTTIVRRYYEGLPPRRIAALDGVPVKTVKTRLVRGLAQLRASLDREFGGERGAWLAAFQPWLGVAHGPTILGVSLMSAKLKTALAAAAVLCVLLVGWRLRTAARAEGSAASAVSVAELASVGVVPEHEATAEPTTDAPSREVLAPVAPVVVPLQATFVHGRVLDLEERPVAGIGVWSYAPHHRSAAGLDQRPPEATTDADGVFALPMPTHEAVAVIASDSRRSTVLSADLWALLPDAHPLVIVAPRVRIAGVVLDSDGNPLAGARVWSEADPVLRLRFTSIVDSCADMRASVRESDALGRFVLDDVAGGASVVKAFSPGFEEVGVAAPASSRDDLALTLSKTSGDALVVRGRVLDAGGEPVAAAWVSLASLCTRSGADGTFQLSVSEARDWPGIVADVRGAYGRAQAELVAVAPAHLPARMEFQEFSELRALAKPDELIQLTLGGEPLSISGYVRDDHGRPVEGAEVWPLLDPDVVHRPGGEDDGSLETTVEALMKGGMDAERVRTAADGSFVLGGLLERSYTIGALHRATTRSAKVQASAGSTDVVIHLESEDACHPLGGRVVSLDGQPLHGVQVIPLNDATLVFGERVVTGADGAFEFAALSSHVSAFLVWSQDLFDTVPRGDPDQELVIRVSRRCRFQVWRGAFEASGYRVLDEAGHELGLTVTHGPEGWSGEVLGFEGDRSYQTSVSELARTVVLLQEGQEIARRSFTPDPEHLVVVRF